MLRILFTVAAIAVYQQEIPRHILCKYNVSGDFFICAWLMLTRIIFEDADFEIVEVDGFYKMVFTESGFAASLKLTDV